MKKTLIATTLVATAAAGTTVLLAAPANADVERRGTCAGATYELSVDRERGGFEVDADVDRATVGSQWRVPIRHDGALATTRVLRADDEGELDLDVRRRNTAGTDTFTLVLTPAGGKACSARITMP
jgi:hypothetical protein